MRASKVPEAVDETVPDDYYSDAADEEVVREASREVAGAEPRVSGSRRR